MHAIHDAVSLNGNIASLEEVEDRLERLAKAFSGSELEPLAIFTTAYLLVTRAVHERLAAGYFKNGDMILALDTQFAGYYLRAIDDYLHERPTTPAWQLLFDSCKAGNLKRQAYLALGANAHINNDLGMSICDINPPAGFDRDFWRMSRVIDGVVPDIIEQCQVGPNNFGTRLVARWLIRFWRLNSWITYRSLRLQQRSRQGVEQRVAAIGQALLTVPWRA